MRKFIIKNKSSMKMSKILSIYQKLFSHFTPQHWWPVTEKGKIHPEYSGGPKNEKQQLEVCFGAILAQNIYISY